MDAAAREIDFATARLIALCLQAGASAERGRYHCGII